jgi:F-type H+-transporting ATPase subunit delta
MSLSVARRYARALYEDAAQKESVDRVDEDVAMIQESLDGSPDLKRLFSDPIVSGEKKTAVVEALFAERVHASTLSFLKLLIEKGRETIFTDIVASYQELRDVQLGIVEAYVRSALPMSTAEEKKIIAGLETMTGKKIRLRTEIDRQLLGGLVIRLGDTVYDGSVRHQLTTLHDQLEMSRISSN